MKSILDQILSTMNQYNNPVVGIFMLVGVIILIIITIGILGIFFSANSPFLNILGIFVVILIVGGWRESNSHYNSIDDVNKKSLGRKSFTNNAVPRYCPKCGSANITPLRITEQPRHNDTLNLIIYLVLLFLCFIFIMLTLSGVAVILSNSGQFIRSISLVIISSLLAFCSLKGYRKYKSKHDTAYAIFIQQYNLWSRGFECQKCGNKFLR